MDIVSLLYLLDAFLLVVVVRAERIVSVVVVVLVIVERVLLHGIICSGHDGESYRQQWASVCVCLRTKIRHLLIVVIGNLYPGHVVAFVETMQS